MPSIKHVHIFIILILVIPGSFCKEQIESIKNLSDLPLKEDLKYFIVSLQKVVEYFGTIRSNGLTSIAYGVYFVLVNLKTALRYKHNMARSLQRQLIDLVETTQSELSYILEDFKYHSCPENLLHKFNLMVLQESPTLWIQRMASVDARPPPPLNTRKSYPPVIYDFTSDTSGGAACGESLISNVKYEMDEPLCTPNKDCYNFLLNDEHIYISQLSQRLLMLVIARFARGCSMFSVAEDQQLLAHNCAIVYEELDIIFTVAHKEFLGLAFEHQALCLLAGHREFHRRALYNKVMKYQQRQGCFALEKPKRRDLHQSANMLYRRWDSTFSDDDDEVQCSEDLSAVAAAFLSAGVRFMVNGEVD